MNTNINTPNHSLVVNTTRRLICNHDCLMIGRSMALSKQNHIGSSTPQANRTAALIATRRKMRQMMRSLSQNEEIHNSHTSADMLKTPHENTPSVLRMSMMGSGPSTSPPNSSVTFTESNGELSPLNFISEDSDDDSVSSSTMDFVRSLGNHREEEQDLMETIDEIISWDEASIIPYRAILG
ncbi:predicted protein [Chaetoceros tenuissimus]|uniref:Uncharacterized protein n=1 Tax=Chaetoceros tenuissimus TaxID=426638 RepID=A0AAD3CHS2_9STRA|nr:predicted protein [Chaetoceros tenuissimus]